MQMTVPSAIVMPMPGVPAPADDSSLDHPADGSAFVHHDAFPTSSSLLQATVGALPPADLFDAVVDNLWDLSQSPADTKRDAESPHPLPSPSPVDVKTSTADSLGNNLQGALPAGSNGDSVSDDGKGGRPLPPPTGSRAARILPRGAGGKFISTKAKAKARPARHLSRGGRVRKSPPRDSNGKFCSRAQKTGRQSPQSAQGETYDGEAPQTAATMWQTKADTSTTPLDGSWQWAADSGTTGGYDVCLLDSYLQADGITLPGIYGNCYVVNSIAEMDEMQRCYIEDPPPPGFLEPWPADGTDLLWSGPLSATL